MLADEIADAWFGSDGPALNSGRSTSVDLSDPSLGDGLVGALEGGPGRASAALVAAAADGAAEVARLRSSSQGQQRLCVVVPGGTGTTALFLARHLQPRGIQVSSGSSCWPFCLAS